MEHLFDDAGTAHGLLPDRLRWLISQWRQLKRLPDDGAYAAERAKAQAGEEA